MSMHSIESKKDVSLENEDCEDNNKDKIIVDQHSLVQQINGVYYSENQTIKKDEQLISPSQRSVCEEVVKKDIIDNQPNINGIHNHNNNNNKDKDKDNDIINDNTENKANVQSKRHKKIDVSRYVQDAIGYINEIRSNPKKYIEEIKNAIPWIKTENNRLIYSGRIKVALNAGKEMFYEAIRVLEGTEPLPPFEINDSIAIECPVNEEEIKDAKVFLKKLIEKKKTVDIDAYFKDAVREAYVSTLLIWIDDSGKYSGKKRNAILSKTYTKMAITSYYVNKVFVAYYTFAK